MIVGIWFDWLFWSFVCGISIFNLRLIITDKALKANFTLSPLSVGSYFDLLSNLIELTIYVIAFVSFITQITGLLYPDGDVATFISEKVTITTIQIMYVGAVIVLIIVPEGIVRSISRGQITKSIDKSGTCYHRQESPFEYWMFIIMGILCSLLAIGIVNVFYSTIIG